VANETSRIASTPLLGLNPLGSVGDRNYGRLVDIVSTRFGARHAALFAEPEPLGDGSAIDWYVPGLMRGTRLSELPPDQAASVRSTLESLSRDIRNYADQIDQGPRNPANTALVETLRNALCVPGPDYVYAVNGQPVLVAWAYRFEKDPPPLEVGLVRSIALPGTPDPAAPPRGEVGREPPGEPRKAPGPGPVQDRPPPGDPDAVAPAAVASAAPAVRKRPQGAWFLWPLWLLFGTLVASILWLLLGACAINLGRNAWPSITWCGGTPGADEANQVADLQGLVDSLQEQLGRRSRECGGGQLVLLQPPEPPRPPERPQQQTTPPNRQDIEERKRENDAQSGALEISLAWNGPADLDLHVQCPDGTVINFRSPEACGGRLQIDMNAGDQTSDQPIEHILFPSASGLPRGRLKIGVSWFNEKGEQRDKLPATILVKRGSQTQEKRIEIPRPSSWGGDPVFYWEIPTR
jgi:hypothetical protein